MRLLHDRYVLTGFDRVCDLATGEDLAVHTLAHANAEPCPPAVALVLDALDHAREGEPQRQVLLARDGAERRAIVGALANGSQRRGFVPIAVEMYEEARRLLPDCLHERAVLLIDAKGNGERADACLRWAASSSARPQVLVTIDRPVRQHMVREARGRFGATARQAVAAVHPEVARLETRATAAAGLVALGRHAAAERVLREVTAALERRRAFQEASGVALSLGRMLLERGRVKESDASCEEAARLANLVGDGPRACEAHLMQAWARFEQARITDAESIARAVVLSSSSDSVAMCARTVVARSLLQQRRFRELAALDFRVDAALPVTPWWAAMMQDVATSILIETGRLKDAGRAVRAALDHWGSQSDGPASALLYTAHLRVLASTGDPILSSEALRRTVDAARRARAPLRALRARVIWCTAFPDASIFGVEHEGERLRRFVRAAPAMIRQEIAHALRPPVISKSPNVIAGQGAVAAAMLTLVQDEDDERAVRAVMAFALTQLDASRLDLVSSDAGPGTTIVTAGAGLPAALGERVLEAGISLDVDTPAESGVPVRLGARQLGALVARWPTGRTPPSDRRHLLECAAAVLAARLDALQQQGREVAAVSVDIPELLGVSAATAQLRKSILRAARAPFSVLIEGESGVGKELVARAIHQLSPRRERRFCDVNCAALPDDLFEAELFGHAKGAFTGAVSDRPGLFEDASGGTLFLDEVAELSGRAQAKLLRAVQQQEIRRLGESFARSVDVRFVAAANRQMADEVSAGRFRADLLYRLDVIRIRIAPLRERPEDIPVIAQHAWREAASRVGSTAALTSAAVAALAHYSWPGNVRELQNVIAALAVAAPARGRVSASLLPPVIGCATGVSAGRLAHARDQFERRFIELALARAAGNRTRAARALGLSRQGLLKSMARLGLRVPSADHDDQASQLTR